MIDAKVLALRARVLVMGLLAGPTVFLGIVLFLVSTRKHEAVEGNLHLVLCAVTMAGLVFALMARALLTRQLPQGLNRENFDQIYLRLVILRFSLLEAPALLGLIANLITGTGASVVDQPWFFVNHVPYLVLVGTAATDFPSAARFQAIHDALPPPASEASP